MSDPKDGGTVQTWMNPVTGHFESQAEIDAAKAARFISLRDRIAIATFKALMRLPAAVHNEPIATARLAYSFADAMLAARERSKP